MSEVEKLDVCATLGLYVEYAQKERQFYNDVIQQAKDTPDQLTHPTFDFSENFALPYHARQPGPVDIKVLFRVNNFGIANQPAKSQTHHLFQEGQTIAMDKINGPNCVVSMLDHYLRKNEPSQQLHAHCNNCWVRNKNKTVLVYLCWRVSLGMEADIQLSFMTVGHTRCSVDGGFGMATQKFPSVDCETMAQLKEVVDSSAHSNSADVFSWEWKD